MLKINGKAVLKISTDNQNRKFTFKKIDKDRHMLRNPPGFAYDLEILRQVEFFDAQYHLVQDKQTGTCWSAWHSDFDIHGIRINRGYGEQVVLELQYWQLGREPRECEVIEIPQPSQFELFESDDREVA